MDSAKEPISTEVKSVLRGPARRRKPKLQIAALLLIAVFVWFARQSSWAKPSQPKALTGKVPLEAHIMSKCPDARDCLEDLIIPAMQNVSDKVEFTLSFLGRLTDDDDGVECMHGPSECLGNILELCAASLYPDPKLYLGFAMCMSRTYNQIPQRELVSNCALEHGIDFHKLNDCASREDGAYGIGLLRNSVQRSARLNVTLSCTVRLSYENWCIRDGGKWKNCDSGSTPKDLISAINEKYETVNNRTS